MAILIMDFMLMPKENFAKALIYVAFKYAKKLSYKKYIMNKSSSPTKAISKESISN